jgi:hypothetical protein
MPKLFYALNAARANRGASPLRIDRGLALIAQRAATTYQKIGRGLEQRVAAQADADLCSFSLVFERVAAAVVFVENIDEAVRVLQPALDPEMQFIGLDVAQGPPPTSPQAGFAVVATVGR